LRIFGWEVQLLRIWCWSTQLLNKFLIPPEESTDKTEFLLHVTYNKQEKKLHNENTGKAYW